MSSTPIIVRDFPKLTQAEHPATPSSSSSSSISLFQSPSLPSLISASPLASPSTARTSRYSSLASGSSISAESHGWWAPGFDQDRESYHRPSIAGPSHSFSSSYFESSIAVSSSLYLDEHDAKRRRSDGPLVTRDTEENARLRWQAQTRTPSAPSESFQHNRVINLNTPRLAVGRMSISTSLGGQPPSPYSDSATPVDRRPSAVSRSLSLVSGPLANSFANLSASERERERERERQQSFSHDMPPPAIERKPSLFPVLTDTDRYLPSPVGPFHRAIRQTIASDTPPPEHLQSRNSSSPSATPVPEPAMKLESNAKRPPARRRSSLTELIMAKSGDDPLSRTNVAGKQISVDSSVPLDKASLSEPLIRGWAGPRETPDSDASFPPGQDKVSGTDRATGGDFSKRTGPPNRASGIEQERYQDASAKDVAPFVGGLSQDEDQEDEGSAASTSKPHSRVHSRSHSRSGEASHSQLQREPSPGDPAESGMRGMAVLADSATRVAALVPSSDAGQSLSGEAQSRRISLSSSRGGETDAKDDMDIDRDRDAKDKEGSPPMTVIQGPGGPKYQCGYCAKTFSRPSSLRIHTYSRELRPCLPRFNVRHLLTIDTGERPFVCSEPSCGRRFSVQSNLKRHSKVHQAGGAGGASMSQLASSLGMSTYHGPGQDQQAPVLVHPQPYPQAHTPPQALPPRSHPQSVIQPSSQGLSVVHEPPYEYDHHYQSHQQRSNSNQHPPHYQQGPDGYYRQPNDRTQTYSAYPQPMPYPHSPYPMQYPQPSPIVRAPPPPHPSYDHHPHSAYYELQHHPSARSGLAPGPGPPPPGYTHAHSLDLRGQSGSETNRPRQRGRPSRDPIERSEDKRAGGIKREVGLDETGAEAEGEGQGEVAGRGNLHTVEDEDKNEDEDELDEDEEEEEGKEGD